MRQPLTPGQLLVRGRALIHLRQPQYALNDLQQAYSRREEATLFPSAIDPMSDAAEALLAEALYLNRRFREAIPNFEKVLNRSSSDLRIILAYSECLDANGQIGAALEFLKRQSKTHKNAIEIIKHGYRLIVKYPDSNQVAEDWLMEMQMRCS
jgi:tetratricopeptide (TPR) repeat protein